jgi:hypothetical protein
MEFRLIRLLPEKTSSLECGIVHASLEHTPDYVAISYTWGDGVDKATLVLDDATVTVTASLYGALRAVRERTHPILVWIDGLCIDQQNKTEQASQVQLMNQIYSRATLVAIWLGPEADDSELAITLLQEIEKGGLSNQRIRATNNTDSAALLSLLQRDYWSRLWVVQEVYLAREKRVYCGSSQLPWNIYRVASDAVWEGESNPYLRRGPSSFLNISLSMILGADSLLEALRACRRKLSQNPRDKVFGLLALLREDIRKEIPVNYTQTVKALYIHVATYIIISTRRLDVIRESIHFPVHTSSFGLPSWCPDWSHIPEITALLGRTFSAAGNSDAEYKFYDSGRKLEFSAVDLGTIGTTGAAVGTLCTVYDYLMAFLNWRALLLDAFAIDETNEYILMDAFCRTLSLGQVPPHYEHSGWQVPCYHVFASLIQERLPRLAVDPGLKRYINAAIMNPNERRMFLQTHFGDSMVCH